MPRRRIQRVQRPNRLCDDDLERVFRCSLQGNLGGEPRAETVVDGEGKASDSLENGAFARTLVADVDELFALVRTGYSSSVVRTRGWKINHGKQDIHTCGRLRSSLMANNFFNSSMNPSLIIVSSFPRCSGTMAVEASWSVSRSMASSEDS